MPHTFCFSITFLSTTVIADTCTYMYVTTAELITERDDRSNNGTAQLEYLRTSPICSTIYVHVVVR